MDELIMERDDLSDIPRYELADGYLIRPYRPGDEMHWYEIHGNADQYTDVSKDLFAAQFGNDVAELSRRQLYLHCGSDVIGTATAWYDLHYKDGTFARVHWLAIMTEHQGLGLSKPLLSEACLTLVRLGYEKAYLTTSPQRVVAVHLYEMFGFTIVKGQ